MYSSGERIAQDKEETEKWFSLAAEQDVAESQFTLAVMCFYGERTACDKTEAAKWYRRAAEQGMPEAQFNLGKLYADGDGLTRNKT
jgi:TPR repeat protein